MKITKTTEKKKKPDYSKLGFGKYFTDHMLQMFYRDGAWSEPEIVPYKHFSMDPASTVLHYGQGIFEGAKAYINPEGKINLFRIKENFLRMNRSAERLCMQTLPVDEVINALYELVKLDKEWIPTDSGTSLYIRPTMVGIDEMLGVHPSHSYVFYIILSPVGSYYANGLKPTRILIENEYVRAPLGGTGEAKCMGNYSASLLAGELANKKGYDQVLWLDGKEHKYVEEVGSMNMFFVLGDTVVTPALVGSILPGITRKSCIEVLKRNGYKVEERRVSVDEILEAAKNGTLKEAFGTGTAAVISPVGVLGYQGEDILINEGKMGEVSAFLYDEITGMQYGKKADAFGWITTLD